MNFLPADVHSNASICKVHTETRLTRKGPSERLKLVRVHAYVAVLRSHMEAFLLSNLCSLLDQHMHATLFTDSD